MKSTNKKVVGGFLVILLLATIGAVLVSAESDEIIEDLTEKNIFRCRPGFRIYSDLGLFSELTDEQKTDIQEIRTTMTENGATQQEIMQATTDKLREYGYDIPTQDDILEKQIQQTEQQLDRLQRQKDFREEGYSWEEIQSIIQEEFDLPEMNEYGQGMMQHQGFCGRRCHEGFGRTPRIEEESEEV